MELKAEVKSAGRTLDVLELLASTDKPLGLNELFHILEIPKSSLHGIIHTLLARGWVEVYEPSKGYLLGPSAIATAGSLMRNNLVISSAQSRVDRLAGATGETIQVGRLLGAEVIYIAQRLSQHPVGLISSVGQRLPAHATALGKAILAQLPDASVRALVSDPLVALTENTVTSLDQLLAELDETRRRGHALDQEESSIGLLCYAVALPMIQPDVRIAISISVPKFRLTEQLEAKIVESLRHELQ